MSDNIEIEQQDKDKILAPDPPPSGPLALNQETPTNEELNIAAKEKKKEEVKTRVNYKDNNYLKSLLDKPKEVPTTGSVLGAGNGDGKDDVRSRLLSDAAPLASAPVASDESDYSADLIVEIVDWLLVAVITWWSKDATDRDYQTDPGKKKILKKYVGKWLAKQQEKYPMEFWLIMAILGTYGLSARKAFVARKENQKNAPSKPASTPRRRLRRTGDKDNN